jgi:hypothetical protein
MGFDHQTWNIHALRSKCYNENYCTTAMVNKPKFNWVQRSGSLLGWLDVSMWCWCLMFQRLWPSTLSTIDITSTISCVYKKLLSAPGWTIFGSRSWSSGCNWHNPLWTRTDDRQTASHTNISPLKKSSRQLLTAVSLKQPTLPLQWHG